MALTYRPETNVFAFGNIEDVIGNTLLVSYAREGRERRTDAIAVPLEDVLFPGEINARDPRQGNTYAANEVVLKTIGVDTAEAYAVLATQEDPSHPLLVSRIAHVPERGWQIVGEALLYNPERYSTQRFCRSCNVGDSSRLCIRFSTS